LHNITLAYPEDAKFIQTLNKHGCTEFAVVTEGQQEIPISYWQNQEHIKQWKQNPEHSAAQELGRTKISALDGFRTAHNHGKTHRTSWSAAAT